MYEIVAKDATVCGTRSVSLGQMVLVNNEASSCCGCNRRYLSSNILTWEDCGEGQIKCREVGLV